MRTILTCFDSRSAGRSANGVVPASQAMRSVRDRISAPRSSCEKAKQMGRVVALGIPSELSISAYCLFFASTCFCMASISSGGSSVFLTGSNALFAGVRALSAAYTRVSSEEQAGAVDG